MAAPEEDQEYLKLPVDERCVNKLWKARLSGYEEAKKLFNQWDGDEAAWKKYTPIIKKFVVDSNAIAQEKGLEAALAYVENCDASPRVASEVTDGLVTKCLGAPKAKTKDLARQVALMLCEVEAHEKVVEDLIKGLAQKNPKVVSGCLGTMTECLRSFGAKVIKVSPLLKATMPLLDHRDKTVREEGKQLIIESYRWVGDIMKQQLSGLKPVQLSELEAEFEKVTGAGKAKPTRYLRSQMPTAVGGGGGGGGGGEGGEAGGGGDGEEEEEEAMDPYDLMDPVDIISQLPKDFYQLVEEKKWQLRKQALDALLPLSQTPKIVPGDFHDLIACLKKFVAKDTNVMLVALAAQCLAGLAKGLRGSFRNFANQILPIALEKQKEKKANVVAALIELLDALYPVLGIESVQEECLAALKHKTPTVVAGTAKFLARSFARCPPQLATNKKCLKGYVSSLMERLSHSDVTVRDAASEALGVLVKYLGEPQITKLMPDLDNIKLAKIKEFAEKAELTGKPPKIAAQPASKPQPAKKGPRVVKPAAAAAPSNEDSGDEIGDDAPVAASKPPPKKTSVNKPVYDKSKVRSKISSAPSGGSRKPAGTAGSSAAGVAGKLSLRPATGGTGGSRKKGEEADLSPLYVENGLKQQRFKEEAKLKILKWNFTTPRQEFVEQLKEQMSTAGLNTTLTTQMFHSDFKQHLKAIESLHAYLPNSLPALRCNLDLVLKWMTLRFFETNPSVLLRGLAYLLEVFTLLAEQDYQMHEIEAVSFIPYLINKVGDPKDQVKNSVKNIIKKMSNVYPASKMSGFLMSGLQSKNAKQRAEVLDELCHLIRGFGSSVLQPAVAQNMKDIAKQISDRDNGVRNAALNCVTETYFQDGEKLYKVIGNLCDKDMAMLEERIKRQSKNRPLPGSAAPQETNGAGPRSGGPKINPPPPAERPQLGSAVRTRPNTAGGVPADGPPPPTARARQQQGTSPSKLRPVSGAFTLDLDKIESAVDNIGDSGIKLVNHKLDEIFNDEPVKLPPTITGRRQFGTVQQYPSPPSSGEPAASSGLGRLGSPPSANHHYASQNDRPLTDMPEAYEALDVVLAQIFNQDSQTCITALSQLDELLKDEEKVPLLGQRMDQLLVACYMQYRHVLTTKMTADNSDPKEVMRLFQFLTMVLMSTYHHQDLTKQASTTALHDLLHIILSILLEPAVQELPQGGQLIRALNVLTVKIVERSDHTGVTCAFVKLLGEAVGNSSLPAKYIELVMKCLWKVIRALPNWINEVNLDVLLAELHDFLKAYPGSYWKRQPEGVPDTPMRTIKTILHTLAKLRGDEILDHVTRIQDPENSELVPYLRKLLNNGIGKENNNNANQNRGGGGSENAGGSLQQKKHSAGLSRFSKSDHEALAEIFKKIGQKELTKVGLQELYNFKQQNPGADLEPFLAKSSQYFRDYIERGLKNIEREVASSAPTSGAGLSAGESAAAAGILADATENGQQSSSDVPAHSQYLARLRRLREQGGLEEAGRKQAVGYKIATTRFESNYSSTSASSSGVSSSERRFAAMPADEASLPESSSTAASAAETGGADSGVEDIRKRLEKIRQSAF